MLGDFRRPCSDARARCRGGKHRVAPHLQCAHVREERDSLCIPLSVRLCFGVCVPFSQLEFLGLKCNTCRCVL